MRIELNFSHRTFMNQAHNHKHLSAVVCINKCAYSKGVQTQTLEVKNATTTTG